MSIAQDFMAELDYEMPTARKLLERVPSDKGPWKPHPKSSALGHLAQLHGDQVLDTAPRKEVLRNTVNHFVHHRAQLTVYLRMNDVPLPRLYGPTADEPW